MLDMSDNEDMNSQRSHSSVNMPIDLIKKESDANDVSENSPISVKEMIKRYNTAALKPPSSPKPVTRKQSLSPPRSDHHLLGTNSSSYLELNKYNDFMDGDGENASMRRSGSAGNMHFGNGYGAGGEEYGQGQGNTPSSTTDFNIDAGEYIADHTRRSTSTPTVLDDPAKLELTATGDCQLTSHPSNTVIVNKSSSNLSIPEDISYQSKTIISKTPMGVRITIDIFLEGDQPLLEMDMIGSRIETDIPQSRILQDFRMQSKLAKLNNESKETTVVADKDQLE